MNTPQAEPFTASVRANPNRTRRTRALVFCVEFLAGLRDSMNLRAALKRYLLNACQNSDEIWDIVKRRWLKTIIYFACIQLVYFLTRLFMPQVAEWVICRFLMTVSWISLMVYRVIWMSRIVDAMKRIDQVTGMHTPKEARATLEEARAPKHSQHTSIANMVKKYVFLLVYLIVCATAVQASRFVPFVGAAAVVALYAFYFAIFLFFTKWDYAPEILYYFERHVGYFIGFGAVFSAFVWLFAYATTESLWQLIMQDVVYSVLFQLFCFPMMRSQPPIIVLKDEPPVEGLPQLTLESPLDVWRAFKALPKPADTHLRTYTEHLLQFAYDAGYRAQCKQITYFKIVHWPTELISTLLKKVLAQTAQQKAAIAK